MWRDTALDGAESKDPNDACPVDTVRTLSTTEARACSPRFFPGAENITCRRENPVLRLGWLKSLESRRLDKYRWGPSTPRIKLSVCDRSAKRSAQDDGFVWGLACTWLDMQEYE